MAPTLYLPPILFVCNASIRLFNAHYYLKKKGWKSKRCVKSIQQIINYREWRDFFKEIHGVSLSLNIIKSIQIRQVPSNGKSSPRTTVSSSHEHWPNLIIYSQNVCVSISGGIIPTLEEGNWSCNHFGVRLQALAILEEISTRKKTSAFHSLVLTRPVSLSELGSSPTVLSTSTKNSQARLRLASHQMVSSSTYIPLLCVKPSSLKAGLTVATTTCIQLTSFM